MAKHIILLGAGASVPFGAPVMANFLDVARTLHASGKTGKDRERFENVFSAISSLQAVHSKAEFDLVNIESIFTAFELAKTLRKFPDRKPEDLDKLIEDLKKVIIVTIERTMIFAVSGGQIQAPHEVVQFLKNLKDGRDDISQQFAVLTFNYDIAWDFALLQAGLDVDYGFVAKPNGNSHVPLLKLHGSINWGVETASGAVRPWYLRDYFLHYQLPPHAGHKTSAIPIGSQIFNLQQYAPDAKQINPVPLVVPPSWNKADSHRAVSAVWERAASELAEAESIYIIGYSLPETDSFFRQLYALGSVGKALLKRFWVLNPDPSREGVFKSMLGPGARSRFKYYDDTADQALHRIAEAIHGEP